MGASTSTARAPQPSERVPARVRRAVDIVKPKDLHSSKRVVRSIKQFVEESFHEVLDFDGGFAPARRRPMSIDVEMLSAGHHGRPHLWINVRNGMATGVCRQVSGCGLETACAYRGADDP